MEAFLDVPFAASIWWSCWTVMWSGFFNSLSPPFIYLLCVKMKKVLPAEPGQVGIAVGLISTKELSEGFKSFPSTFLSCLMRKPWQLEEDMVSAKWKALRSMSRKRSGSFGHVTKLPHTGLSDKRQSMLSKGSWPEMAGFLLFWISLPWQCYLKMFVETRQGVPGKSKTWNKMAKLEKRSL